MLAERCALLSAEILKSQGKYSETATLLIKMTSEVRSTGTPAASLLRPRVEDRELTCQPGSDEPWCRVLWRRIPGCQQPCSLTAAAV